MHRYVLFTSSGSGTWARTGTGAGGVTHESLEHELGRSEPERFNDLVTHRSRRRRGECHERHIRQHRAHRCEACIVRPKVVAPSGDAVSLVECDEREATRRIEHQEPVEQPVQRSGHRNTNSNSPRRACVSTLTSGCADPRKECLHATPSEICHLVAHQGDERRNYERSKTADERWKLEARTLAAPSGGEHKTVAPLAPCGKRASLPVAKLGDAEAAAGSRYPRFLDGRLDLGKLLRRRLQVRRTACWEKASRDPEPAIERGRPLQACVQLEVRRPTTPPACKLTCLCSACPSSRP